MPGLSLTLFSRLSRVEPVLLHVGPQLLRHLARGDRRAAEDLLERVVAATEIHRVTAESLLALLRCFLFLHDLLLGNLLLRYFFLRYLLRRLLFLLHHNASSAGRALAHHEPRITSLVLHQIPGVYNRFVDKEK